MKALNTIRFPRMLQLSRSIEERQFDESNQFRMNQNFRAITDAVTAAEESLSLMPEKIMGSITVPDDYVTEIGESGVWKYRKWKNGTVECWCESLELQKAITAASGSLYVATDSLSLPSGFFSEIDSVLVGVAASSAVCFASVSSFSASSVSVNIASTISASVSLKLYAHVFGRLEE